jgi:hypothetical protein
MGAGIGGFFAALSCFGLYAQYSNYANLSPEGNVLESYKVGQVTYISKTSTGTTVDNSFRFMATIFLVCGIIYLVVDLILLGVGGFRYKKAKSEGRSIGVDR